MRATAARIDRLMVAVGSQSSSEEPAGGPKVSHPPRRLPNRQAVVGSERGGVDPTLAGSRAARRVGEETTEPVEDW